jgi:hypothetical protein
MAWNLWVSRWEQTLQACQRLGGDARWLNIGRPATFVLAETEREKGKKASLALASERRDA